MGSVRITRAPEERIPAFSIFSVDAATTGKPLPMNPSVPTLPPAVILTSSAAPVNAPPVPTATVAHIYTHNNNNSNSSNDSNLFASGHQRVHSNATHSHSQGASTSSTDDQEKVGHARNTVQAATEGTPSSLTQPIRSSHNQARYASSKHAQALVTPITGTETTAAATIADGRLISMQLAAPAATTRPTGARPPRARPPGAPKQFNVQPRPQTWYDPKDINQAPQETQDRIQGYSAHIQSRDWNEFPLPRLFTVLPKSCLHNSKLTLGWDKFRFFWMCEFVDPAQTPVMGGGFGGLAPHVGDHGGYDLVHPEEFFRKY